jgi:hypothetical protein
MDVGRAAKGQSRSPDDTPTADHASSYYAGDTAGNAPVRGSDAKIEPDHASQLPVADAATTKAPIGDGPKRCGAQAPADLTERPVTGGRQDRRVRNRPMPARTSPP